MSTRKVLIYILQLENGKYYVGKTNDIKQRSLSHFSGKGSQWTQMYKPIQIVNVVEGDDFDEEKHTLLAMEKYGINNVRGGSYSQCTLSEHDYQKAEQTIRSVFNRCFKCGETGHFVYQCNKINIHLQPQPQFQPQLTSTIDSPIQRLLHENTTNQMTQKKPKKVKKETKKVTKKQIEKENKTKNENKLQKLLHFNDPPKLDNTNLRRSERIKNKQLTQPIKEPKPKKIDKVVKPKTKKCKIEKSENKLECIALIALKQIDKLASYELLSKTIVYKNLVLQFQNKTLEFNDFDQWKKEWTLIVPDECLFFLDSNENGCKTTETINLYTNNNKIYLCIDYLCNNPKNCKLLLKYNITIN